MLNKFMSLLVIVTAMGFISGCNKENQISYKKSIEPIINKYCVECHATDEGKGTQMSGFRMDTYANLMKGTKYGPVIVAENAIASSFYRLVAGKVDPSIQMPHGKESLTADEISLIERWINQGAKNN